MQLAVTLFSPFKHFTAWFIAWVLVGFAKKHCAERSLQLVCRKLAKSLAKDFTTQFT